MSDAAQQVLDSFDALDESEKQEVAVSIIRRLGESTPDGMSDRALIELAEHLFLELDEREAADAES